MQIFRSRFPAILALALAAVIVTGCSPKAKEARHLKRADDYFKSGEYEKAKIEYLTVLRMDPRNVPAIAQTGIIWSEQGAPLRAFPYLLKARDLDPGNLKARVKLALAYMSIGRSADARKEVSAVLEKSPADDEAIVLLAATVTTQEEWDATASQLKKSNGPDEAAFHLASAALSMQKGDVPSAKSAVQEALAMDPKSVPAHLAMAGIYRIAKNTAQADEEFKTAAALAPARSPARLQYAEFKVKTGAVDEAKGILADVTSKTPDYLPAWVALAQIAYGEKKYDESLKSIENVLGRDPVNYNARILQAQVWLAKGDAKKAVEDMETLDKAYPGSPGIKYYLARAYLQNGNPTQAIASLNQALTTNPEYVEAVLLLAEINLRSGNAQATAASMEALLKKHPGLEQAQLLLADAYRSLGRLEDAASLFRNQIRVSPQSAVSYFMLGMILRQQGKIPEARTAFEKAHELSPADMATMYQLVELDIADKNFDAALNRVQQQLQKTPQSAGAYFLQGRIYAAQRDWDKAGAALQKSIEINPNASSTYELLVSTYVAANKMPDAIKELDVMLAKNPADARALLMSGLVYEKMNDFEKARQRYETILAAKPDAAPVLNNLAYLYAERLNQPDKAYDLAKKARSLQPDDPATADTLGWILYKRGDYQQALTLIQESAGKSPGNAEIQYHLGMASYMMGQTEAAQKALSEAVKATEDFPGKSEIQSRLALLGAASGNPPELSTGELEALLKQQPNDLIARTRLAEAYEKQGAYNKASAAYEEVLKTNPTLLSATVKLAQLYAGPLQNKDKALAVAKKARELAPADPKVAGILGGIAYQTGNFSWAYNLLQDSASQLPNDAGILHNLAWSAYAMGKVSEARDAMQRLVNPAPGSAQAEDAKSFLAMTGLDEKSKDLAASAPEVEKLLKADPDYVPALMVEAAIQTLQSQKDAAIGIYNKVLLRFPDFAPAQKRLAILYADDPSKNAEAYDLAKKARKTLPDDADLALALATLSYQRKEYAYVVQLLQESEKTTHLDAKHLFYLGMSCLQTKQEPEGKKALELALASGLEEPLATETKRSLAGLEKK